MLQFVDITLDHIKLNQVAIVNIIMYDIISYIHIIYRVKLQYVKWIIWLIWFHNISYYIKLFDIMLRCSYFIYIL